MYSILASFVILCLISVEGFLKSYPKVSLSVGDSDDAGTPLFLTPYIENGKIDEARRLARVSLPSLPADLVSYTGFITVDKAYNSNLFFWYFPSRDSLQIHPNTHVWLNGGPGASSLYGLFVENGPIYVKNGTLHLRDRAERDLTLQHNVIYIDNPVGAGFSFTNDSRGYCTNQTQIGEQLYTTLYQFLLMFPELQKVPLIISGESYGGKYAPALAYTIHKRNSVAKVQGKLVIPLRGLTIGNGWCDPINHLDHAAYLYQLGLIDWNQRDEAEKLAEITRELIRKTSWINATQVDFHYWNYLMNAIGNVSYYNYLISEEPPNGGCNYCEILNTIEARKAIHVGNLKYFSDNEEVYTHLEEDFMQSVAPWISELLEHYNILMYSGQLDIIVAYPLTIKFLRNLKWSGQEEYNKAQRFNDISNFYLKRTKDNKLWEAYVTGAGHQVPKDKLLSSTELIEMWELNTLR